MGLGSRFIHIDGKCCAVLHETGAAAAAVQKGACREQYTVIESDPRTCSLFLLYLL